MKQDQLRMTSVFRRCWLLTLCAAICPHICTAPVLADESPQASAQPSGNQGAGERARREALSWLDRYLSVEVLFREQDMQAIRKQVEEMSPVELKEWMQKTEEVRAVLDSPEWRKTREWLRDFLKKQALYSDEEIEQFRADAANMSAEDLLDVLQRIHDKHGTLIHMSGSSRAMNSARLEARDKQLQDAARRSAKARTSGGNRPLFGSTQGYAARKHRSSSSYQASKPLITSQEVSREVVRRSVVGRGYWWGR